MVPNVVAVVLAGGRGARFGGSTPKQYRSLGAASVLQRSLALFSSHAEVAAVQPVIHADDAARFEAAAAGLALLAPTHGGAMRQDSVRAGLEALAGAPPDIVLVHDAARPFVSAELVSRAIAAAAASGAAIPGLPVFDTVKVVDAEGRVRQTLDRGVLRTVQTPQAFRFRPLLEAHRRAAREGRHDFTDDAALAEWAGMTVTVFAGDRGNVKLTTQEDLMEAERQRDHVPPDIRVATGFDVHVFGEGDHVMLGGVRIPHDRGLVGHSDADVGLHALTDAVLGCLSDGDIGTHFPPSDMRWRGASSDQFLAFAVERVRARGGRITLLDLTMLCEAPKIGPHRDAIRARIGEIAGISPSRVAIKATTMEQLGFVGRREGMAAMATATVVLPGSADER